LIFSSARLAALTSRAYRIQPRPGQMGSDQEARMSGARQSDSEKQLREACAFLDRALRQGLPARAETCFAANPLLAVEVPIAVELIYAEFTTREELGQHPTPDEYYLRFPHWKAALQRQFAVHQWLQNSTTEPAGLTGEGAPPAEVPAWLGRYELLDEIGGGGVGRVFRANQHGLDRIVAVKVLRPELSTALAAREEFCREARLMARLRHPHIMSVHDIGEHNGVVYYSMDFMADGSLLDRLRDLPPPGAILNWLETISRAVHHAHVRGVVHCDLKPSNVLLDETGHPVLCDFGLAHLPEAGENSALLRLFAGSPAYMAPEQFRGLPPPPAPAIDIWALGVMLYELLCGQRPFVSDKLADLAQLICAAEYLPLHALTGGLPRQLEEVFARCLARAPEDRYPSAEALADELRRCRG
jgi:serine/threonine-protein kinase